MGRDDCPFLCCSEFGPTFVEIVARIFLCDESSFCRKFCKNVLYSLFQFVKTRVLVEFWKRKLVYQRAGFRSKISVQNQCSKSVFSDSRNGLLLSLHHNALCHCHAQLKKEWGYHFGWRLCHLWLSFMGVSFRFFFLFSVASLETRWQNSRYIYTERESDTAQNYSYLC